MERSIRVRDKIENESYWSDEKIRSLENPGLPARRLHGLKKWPRSLLIIFGGSAELWAPDLHTASGCFWVLSLGLGLPLFCVMVFVKSFPCIRDRP